MFYSTKTCSNMPTHFDIFNSLQPFHKHRFTISYRQDQPSLISHLHLIFSQSYLVALSSLNLFILCLPKVELTVFCFFFFWNCSRADDLYFDIEMSKYRHIFTLTILCIVDIDLYTYTSLDSKNIFTKFLFW